MPQGKDDAPLLHLLRGLAELTGNAREYCAPGHRMGEGYALLEGTLRGPATPNRSPGQQSLEQLADHAEVVNDFRRIARYDHSVSVPHLGSPFQFDPASCLGKDQIDLAEVYGAKFAWPSSNGTTALNIMALMAVTRPGDRVLCQRDSHVSIHAPIIHLGLKPTYVVPRFAPELGVNLGVTPEQLDEALAQDNEREIRAVFLTYPSYYGLATDIRACAEVVERRGIPLIVDSAHGAYYHFHPALPLAAEETTAAVVTQSVHKTCSALNLGSLGLFNSPYGSPLVERFYEVVNQSGFISTSFSYIILQSIMLAVVQLQSEGEKLLGQAIEIAEWVRSEINATGTLYSFGVPDVKRYGVFELDPLRITMNVAQLGLSGYDMANRLIEEFAIYPEVASIGTLMFFLTPADGWEDVRRLVQAIKHIARAPGSRTVPLPPGPPGLPPQRLTPRVAVYQSHRRRMPVREAVGEVSAETIAAYPPGNAVIVAGEEITYEVVEFLHLTQRSGGILKGASDPSFQSVQVLANAKTSAGAPPI